MSSSRLTYLLAIALEEALIEREHLGVDIFEHRDQLVVLDICVGHGIEPHEGLCDIDAQSLLQENVYNDPVGISTRLLIVVIQRGNSEELKHLVLVDVLRHVVQDVLLQVLQLHHIPIKVSNNQQRM
jgi:hypothetical protein